MRCRLPMSAARGSAAHVMDVRFAAGRTVVEAEAAAARAPAAPTRASMEVMANDSGLARLNRLDVCASPPIRGSSCRDSPRRTG